MCSVSIRTRAHDGDLYINNRSTATPFVARMRDLFVARMKSSMKSSHVRMRWVRSITESGIDTKRSKNMNESGVSIYERHILHAEATLWASSYLDISL